MEQPLEIGLVRQTAFLRNLLRSLDVGDWHAARRAPDYLLTLLEDPPDYGELEAEA